MSSKVHTELTSDGKQLMETLRNSQREIEKLTNENKKLRDETKKGAEQAKRGFDESKRSTQDWSASLGGITTRLTGPAGIAFGVAAVFDGLQRLEDKTEDWRAKIDAAGKAMAQAAKVTVGTTSTLGGGVLGQQVENALRHIPGVRTEQGNLLFQKIQEASPGLSIADKLGLTTEAAGQVAAGIPVDQAAQFAGAMGEIADKMPKWTPRQVADYATKFKAASGDKFPELTSDAFQRTIGEMQQAGTPYEQAMAFAAAARQADVSPKTMEAVALAVSEKKGSLADVLKTPSRFLGPDFQDAKLGGVTMDAVEQMRRNLSDNEGAFQRSIRPNTELSARAAANQFVDAQIEQSRIQLERAGIGHTRDLLQKFYESRGMTKEQIEGTRMMQWAFGGIRIPGQMDAFDSMVGLKGMDPEQAAIAMLRSRTIAGGGELLEKERRGERMDSKEKETLAALHGILSVLENIERQQQHGVVDPNAHVRP